MVPGRQLSVERRDKCGNGKEPQSTAVKVVAVLKTVGWHECASYGPEVAADWEQRRLIKDRTKGESSSRVGLSSI